MIFMPRKKRALLMTVGTGTGDKRCSLAHGLMCSIDSKDPDFICFFVSKDSKPTVDALKKVFNNKFDEDFDECYDYEFVENEAVDKFTEYFNEFKSKISELEDDYRILIDYTSGTKTMTMAAAFASMIFRKELFFVSGKREKGIVVKGTEECVPQNLYQVYDELMINKIKDLFNNNRFEAGKVLEVFDIKEFQKAWPDLTKQFQLNIKALNIMNTFNQNSSNGPVEHNLKKYYMLASILNNARRREDENKFVDAVARLYRSLELIAQIRLSKEYGIDSSNVDIDVLRQNNVDEDYLSEINISDEIKFGLTADYELLAKLNDDLGDFYLKNKKQIRNILKFRNNSILAHGFDSCSKKEYDEFNEIVLKAANLLHKDMEKFIEETKFPILL